MNVEKFPEVFEEHAFAVPQSSLKAGGWQLKGTSNRELLDQIRAVGISLDKWCAGRLYSGVKAGLNEAFVINGSERAALIAADPKSATIIKPFLRGRDIKRWRAGSEDQWLIRIESSENRKHPWSGLSAVAAEKVFKETYPAVYNRFNDTHRRAGLINRYDKGQYFWELRSCAYWEAFEQPKIVFPDIALSPQFAFDDGKHYLGNTAYILAGVQPWTLAVLNSSVTAWFYAQISPQIMNGYFRFIAQYVTQIRIPDVTTSQQQFLEAVVSIIRNSPKGSFAYWEQLSNGLVYELFFPDDLHPAGITLFNAADKAGVGALSVLTGEALTKKAEALAAVIFKNDHPIYRMLFDLQALPTVQIIEGKE